MKFAEIICSKCRNYLYIMVVPIMNNSGSLSQEFSGAAAMKISPCQTCLEAEYRRGIESNRKPKKRK